MQPAELFIRALVRRGAQPGWGFSRCWDAIQPQSTPLPGGATPEREGSASEHGKGPRRDLSPVWGRLASRVGSKQSYSTNIQRGPGRRGGRHRLPETGTGALWTRLCGERAGEPSLRVVVRAGRGRHSRGGPAAGAGQRGVGWSSARPEGSPPGWGGVGGWIGDGGGRGELNRSR